MKCLILGDVHGMWEDLGVTIAKAIRKYPDITHVIQMGDFGYGWPGGKPFKFSKAYFAPIKRDLNLSRQEARAFIDNIKFMWLDGNHENHDQLDADNGAWQPDWTYMPRGSVLEIDGYRLMFFGGASSIDKNQRIEGKSWWNQENIKYGQVARTLEKELGPVHALFTHDHASSIPYSEKRYGVDDIACGKSDRQLLQVLIDTYKPKFHFFGHHHFPEEGTIGDMKWICTPIIEMRTYTIWDGKEVICEW